MMIDTNRGLQIGCTVAGNLQGKQKIKIEQDGNRDCSGLPVTDRFEKAGDNESEWSILIYSSATADIDKYSQQALKELEKTGSSEHINIALQLGRSSNVPGASWTGVRRFYITKNDGCSRELTSPAIMDLKNTDMSEPASLEDFIKWGVREYPAKHTMLVIGGHSGGFLGAITNAQKSRLMPIDSITDSINKAASETGVKPDVLVFNSCFMGQIEPLNHLRNAADYLVASEKPEYRQGIPLGAATALIEKELETGKSVSPEKAAEAVIEASSETPHRTPAIAAFKADKLEETGRLLDKLSGELLSAGLSGDEIRELITGSMKPYISERKDPVFSNFVDLKSLSDRIIHCEKLQGLPVIDTAQAFQKTMDEAMTAGFFAETDQLPPEEKIALGEKKTETPGGLSAYIPDYSENGLQGEILNQVEGKYNRLDMAKYPNWVNLRNL